ncbi:cation diffusion facilitator family transporter [Amphibacillus marinus]|uniref:Cation diffusion facilitator family transporter n=1 Tax=Amphibacillus marinus TaxID=872970 RepID=A0A1H8T098_9BACI|nr:cation diffusion facilitator family transporter [Amphibacillus marinus]SEO84499.1 cation diffusion facilitator family transporter [Amphibacillus marinus]
MNDNFYQERRILKLSVYGALLFSFAGIIVGLLIDAQIILFDGLYSLISLGLSILSLISAKFMNKHDMHNYPFGKDKIEPLVVLIKYFVILILVIGSFISAVVNIFTGGTAFAIEAALLYTVISTVICVGVTVYINKWANKIRSGLLQAELNQWRMDTVISIGILIGFLLSFLFSLFERSEFLVPYMDPIMVILVSGYFLKVPITEMGTALRELLDMPPKGRMPDQIKHFVKQIAKEQHFTESFIRVSKVGQTLWVEVDFVIGKQEVPVAKQDEIREQITVFLDQYPFEKWLTVAFTNDRKWAL